MVFKIIFRKDFYDLCFKKLKKYTIIRKFMKNFVLVSTTKKQVKKKWIFSVENQTTFFVFFRSQVKIKMRFFSFFRINIPRFFTKFALKSSIFDKNQINKKAFYLEFNFLQLYKNKILFSNLVISLGLIGTTLRYPGKIP